MTTEDPTHSEELDEERRVHAEQRAGENVEEFKDNVVEEVDEALHNVDDALHEVDDHIHEDDSVSEGSVSSEGEGNTDESIQDVVGE